MQQPRPDRIRWRATDQVERAALSARPRHPRPPVSYITPLQPTGGIVITERARENAKTAGCTPAQLRDVAVRAGQKREPAGRYVINPGLVAIVDENGHIVDVQAAVQATSIKRM